MIELLLNLLKGLAVGATAALVGYVKGLPDGTPFDWKKAAPSFIIGGITGVVASLMNVDLVSAGAIVASFGIVSLVNSLWTTVVKVQKVGVANLKRKK
jgi:hypothetical protein